MRKRRTRLTALILACTTFGSAMASPAYAVYSYYSPSILEAGDAAVRDWTWSAAAEGKAVNDFKLIPSGLSQQQTAVMGGYTTKFWFQDEKSKSASYDWNGTSVEVDFSEFNHRYYSCADSHTSGWFAPPGSQLALKQLYFPTGDIYDYPDFIKNLDADMATKKFTLLMVSMLSAAYKTPSESDLKDSDKSSMYYYLLWASIWANDVYASEGSFSGESPDQDWAFVQRFVREIWGEKLNPDEWGSTAVYDAFQSGGPAQHYFYQCWKAAKFLSAFDFTLDKGISLPVMEPALGDDGMYHLTYDYSGRSDYEREVFRRLEPESLASGWEYTNDGSKIDFKSPDGAGDGGAVAVLKLKENSEEDHYYNCGFGVGGLAGFQGCAKNDRGEQKWGNTQVYFSAVSEPLEITVGGPKAPSPASYEVEVHRYEHTETWQAHYNVQLRKFDSETGQPLAGSKWDILEAFDSSQLDSTSLESSDNWANRGQSQFKKWDGWDYGEGNPEGSAAEDPCSWDINVTGADGRLMLGNNEENASGEAAHTDVKTYTYTKGYCGGHPEPEIEESGDEETDEENEEAAMEAWQEEVDRCEELAAEGGFFHSLNEGEAKAMMEADRDQYYQDFISLTYDYSAVELAPRPGYTLHGSHPEDIPIEIKTVTSSEWKDRGGEGLTAVRKGMAVRENTAERPENRMKEALDTLHEENSLSGSAQSLEAEPATPSQAAKDQKPVFPGDLEEEEEAFLEDCEEEESEEELSSPSEASPSKASQSKKELVRKLKALFEAPKSLIKRGTEAGSFLLRSLAVPFGRGAENPEGTIGGDFEESDLPVVSPGRSDIVDHTFIVYDHRTEGEIHFNKQDLYLNRGEEGYNPYGDSEGDGTLEGAVYGLFALKDIQHPDGHSGVVFQKDDLVAVAATDRNGDGSFMAITEAPGMTYNYRTGAIEKRPGDFAGPDNLYRERAKADAAPDMEQYTGHDLNGSPVSLIDSKDAERGYLKLSSNQPGIEGLTGEFAFYPIADNETQNGNCWIGRPLIVEENGTAYYIKELLRSEGYELSVGGKTNLVTNGEGSQEGTPESADVTISPITLDTDKNGNYFTITAKNVTHDIILKGSDFPEGAAFCLSSMKKVPEKIQVPVYTAVKSPVMAVPGSYVYREGKRVEAALGSSVSFPNGQSYSVGALSDREDKTIGVKPYNYKTLGTPTVTDLHTGGSPEAFQSLYNKELEKLGYKEPGEKSPWVRVRLSGSTDTAWLTSITAAVRARHLQYFNCLRITGMETAGGSTYALLRYERRLYGDSRDDGVYIPEEDLLYLKRDTQNGYFVYVPYEDLETNPAVLARVMKNGFLERATLKDQKVEGLTAAYPDALPDTFHMKTEQSPAYWVYAPGEQERDDKGNLKYTEKTVLTYKEQDGFRQKEVLTKLAAAYNVEDKTYTLTIPKEAFKAGEAVSLKASDSGSGQYSIRQAYINGSSLSHVPLDAAEDSYVKNVLLTKPDAMTPYSDGGTRDNKALVLERPIMQKVKLTKDLSVNGQGAYEDNTYASSGHEDRFTKNGGGKEENARYLKNFRFKAYLKSNLERLYRAEDGSVAWQDRNGNEVDIAAYREAFPEKVQKLYTRADYETVPLTRDSNRAALANTELYGCTEGFINTDQNPGYTRILETVPQTVKDESGGEREVLRYNYEKFFDAINTANSDKWDRADNKSTSFKPYAFIRKLLFGLAGGEALYPADHNNAEILNSVNTSDIAKDNALRSDHVRQFAITWYLDGEVKKLVKKNQAGETEGLRETESYQDEIYDQALSEAIKKAENYLKPFFAYDLDEIYAIAWDSEEGGGKDKDFTTLSADQEDAQAGYCYGVSEYLPYGTYVAVEQQPFDKELCDFLNKHYQTDAPKEIELPAVYEGGKEGADKSPEALSSYYNYNAGDTLEELEAKYHIRFQEEWPDGDGEDLRKYAIAAQSYLGDYEIYKYGLDLDRLSGRFTITQGQNDPVKDYYNTMVDFEEAGGNPDSHYLADDCNAGRTGANGQPYEADAIERIYRYGSVSEDKQVYNGVSFPSGDGEVYRDNVTAMEGMQTAYDGKYASMLVPWSVTEPADEMSDMTPAPDGRGSFKGYAYKKYRNTFYKSFLRIEKLDSETGEGILHDGALFALYAASREDGEDTEGRVRFYERDTLVRGSKEFLEAMGASMILPMARGSLGPGLCYTGVVPAGTPVCTEEEQIVLSDEEGRKTGQFEAFLTTRDGLMAEEENPSGRAFQDQNAGYLITPKPLGAGTYVLCEIKPPAGCVRTKPVAIEIYSDQVSYYLNGNRDSRVAAAIYEDETGEGPVGKEDTARVYVANTPIRLEVSKIKAPEPTVTYRTDTRLEGTQAELKQRYGLENLEFAYKNGAYLGYAWKKGTLEYLEGRKAAGEDVEPVYADGVFAGYGLVSRPLDTADDKNRYVAGAEMALYDAIEIKANGDSGDYGYDGVKVTRDKNNNVQSIQVLKGYAGSTVEFMKKEDEEGSLKGEGGEGTWTYRTVEREDSDILHYSLNGLKATETQSDGKLYGYDRDGSRIQVKNRESIYALKGGRPVFELSGGDLTKVRYSAADKCFTALDTETVLYHLDGEWNRDAMVNPTTGMAYVKEDGRIFVWPVKLAKTAGGAVIAQEKIKTWRTASINADTDQEYTIGTYDGESLKKQMNPVLNSHGLLEYYQISGETYKKGSPIYDIDGDYVRYKYSDLLSPFNKAAYRINSQAELWEIGKEQDTSDDKKLFHRKGEAWVMENAWITGEKYPNDPFKTEKTLGQADMIKRVLPGTYILEEIMAPEGYAKGFPKGVTVAETDQVQTAGMEDEKIKAEIVKTDAPENYRLDVISDYQEGLTETEAKGAYSYGQIKGAHLALYKAERIPTTDYADFPKGYYLVKAEDTPARWTVESTEDNSPVTVTADWITDGSPKYFEGIPAGDYILEEQKAPSGYIRSSMEIEVRPSGEVQTFDLKDDHTKLEVYKYYKDSSGKMSPLPNSHAAGLALYEAETDEAGNIRMENGIPVYDRTKPVTRWTTDDLKEYTELTEKSSGFSARLMDLFGLKENKSSFITDFEAAYEEKGEALTSLAWLTKEGERRAEKETESRTGKGETTVQTWRTDQGKTIRITIYRNVKNGSLDEAGKLPRIFEYQFNYKEEEGVKSCDTLDGMHRIDYLPLNTKKAGNPVGAYVLVEEAVPDGFEAAAPKAVLLSETGAVQRISLENEEKYINVLKTAADGTKECPVSGAHLALYRADEEGRLKEEKAYLKDSWISGTDGSYTEEDRFNGKIPEGFSVGDLRPHRINRTAYGTYYIVETEAPAYFKKMAPVKIQVGAETVPCYRVENRPKEGRLEIEKTASDTGMPLENARFKLTNKDTGDTWHLATGTDGKAELSGLPVGEVQTDGTIKPYTYAIEELSPPELYQISSRSQSFQFSPDAGDEENETAITYRCTIENKPTRICFTKTDFHTGMAVKGAEIAIYKAKAENGRYEKDGEAIETVISGTDGFTLAKKLSANQVYIMEELYAPAGYALSAPVVFIINGAGTGISSVSNDFSILKPAGQNWAVCELTVTGRVPVKVYTVLKDMDTGNELPPFGGTGAGLELTEEAGILDGHLYEITEYTRYSDGRTETSFKETRRIYLNRKDGPEILKGRTYLETRNRLADQEGNLLASWTVNEAGQEYTIKNPVTREVPIASVTSPAGQNHSAVRKGSVIKYSITYTNPYNVPEDLTVTADLEEGLTYMRSTGAGREQNRTVTWSIEKAAPHESGVLEVVAAVTGEEEAKTKASFKTRAGRIEKQTSLVNPIAPEGSLTIVNKLTGTGKDQNDRFTFHVRLIDQDGTALSGYQAYSGSSKGRIKGEGDISLEGDGYVIFAGLPYGTRYEISQEPGNSYSLESPQGQNGEIERALQSAVFINNRDDETIREILTAGGNYILTETTVYSDGEELTSGIYRFRLNAVGQVCTVDMEDRPIRALFSKTDRDTGRELSGGRFSLREAETGKVLYEFTKEGGKKVSIPAGLLVSGREYIIREEEPPEGYAWEEDIRFTAAGSAIEETIVMQDKKTEIEILKTDQETGEALTGGRYSIRRQSDGELMAVFTAEGRPVSFEGVLQAGEAYLLIEEEAPKGYAFTAPMGFIMPRGPEPLQLVMKDKKTEIYMEKLGKGLTPGTPSEAEGRLKGCLLQILNEDKTPARAIRTGEGFQKGEELIFTTGKEEKAVRGQLEAGKSYWLHEVRPADGYAYAEDVFFQVPKGAEKETVLMTDPQTRVILSKKAETGTEELSGNHMSVKDQNGTILEEWESGERPHEIIGKLKAGESYYFCEEKPADGYAFGEPVEFTVSQDGAVTMVEMRNEPTRVRICKIDSEKQQLQGAVLKILDQSGNTIVDDFITDPVPCEIIGILKAGERYILHETAAPDGYLPALNVEFCVPRNKEILEVFMTDLPKPDTAPKQPKEPEPVEKPLIPKERVGTITAHYEKSPLEPRGDRAFISHRSRARMERTGDWSYLKIWLGGVILCLAGLLLFGWNFAVTCIPYQRAGAEYKALRRDVHSLQKRQGEEPEEYLRKLNSDYICWLSIPGTSVDYPVVRNPEPEYYLSHTFYKTENPCGSLFVQEEVQGLEMGNTVIFGHNMKDGSMFGELKNYRDQDFLNNHSRLKIYYEGRWYEGRIFSCQIREEKDLACYKSGPFEERQMQEFLMEMSQASLYPIPVPAPGQRRMVTLSTCYGSSKRMIVQAVLMCYTE